jgi:hypothetical protein
VWLQYDEGSPEIHIPGIGVTARRGEPVEIPDDVAGRPPSGEDGDLGEGLLAQVRRWHRVDDDPAPTGRKVMGTARATVTMSAVAGGEVR